MVETVKSKVETESSEQKVTNMVDQTEAKL